MCFEIFFAECKKNTRQRVSLPSVKKNTRQRASLPSVKKKHSAKSCFAECQKQHSAKSFFAECQKKTLGKDVFVECPKKNTRQTTWHSANSLSPVVCRPFGKLYPRAARRGEGTLLANGGSSSSLTFLRSKPKPATCSIQSPAGEYRVGMEQLWINWFTAWYGVRSKKTCWVAVSSLIFNLPFFNCVQGWVWHLLEEVMMLD